MALGITSEFDEPFSQQSAALPSTFSPSVVAIAGVPYLIDSSNDAYGVGRYSREGFDVVQQRNTNDARDVLLLPQDVWRQQAQSWHLGAGQFNMDRDNSLPARFQSSFGIDPWEKWQLSLHNSTHKMGTYTGSIWLTTYDQYLAVVNDDSIYWYTAPSASVSASTTQIHAGDAVVDIASDGHVVTTLHASGAIYTTDGPGSTPATIHSYAGANFIEWEKDYLILGYENSLYDITTASAGKIFQHPVTTFRWKDAAPGNSCIYVLGGVGDKYVVHRVGIKDDGTGLTPCIVAATLPDGEIGYSIEQYLGYVFIGTSKGVRVAQPNNTSGDLTLGPIIPTNTPVYCFEGQDRFVWFGDSAIDSTYSVSGTGDDETEKFPVGTVCGLSRIDLSSTTTSALTFAYATDISALDETGHDVNAVVTFNDKRVFAINGVGVYAETSEKMAGGWLIQGTMSYGVEDVKTALYMQAKWLPLDGEIEIDLSYDSSGYIRIGEYEIQGSIRSGNTSLNGAQFSRVNARYILEREKAAVDVSPIFTRWELRAIPAKGRASRWTLPIMNYEEIEIDGVKYVRNPVETTETLINLVQSGSIFTFQESGKSYQVHGKDFSWRPEKLTINGKAWEGTFTLVVEEVQ